MTLLVNVRAAGLLAPSQIKDMSLNRLLLSLALTVLSMPLAAHAVQTSTQVNPMQQVEHDRMVADLRTRFGGTDARIAQGQRTRAITPARAKTLHRKVAAVKANMERLAIRQGFVSRAELITYQHSLGAIDVELDRRGVARSYGDDGIVATKADRCRSAETSLRVPLSLECAALQKKGMIAH